MRRTRARVAAMAAAIAVSTTTNFEGVNANAPKEKMPSEYQRLCQDDTFYISRMGYECSDYSELDCNGFRRVGFTDKETDELLARCPLSCRVAPCNTRSGAADTVRYTDATRHQKRVVQSNRRQQSSIIQSDTVVFTSHRPKGHAAFSYATQAHEGIVSKGATCSNRNWDHSCRDDTTFMTHVGFSCEAHTALDCRMFEQIGFTEQQVYDLISACPCSCNVECGSWTKPPSISDSPTPSPSNDPNDLHSEIHSLSPSLKASSGPSTLPTTMPSLSPSFSPSLSPTLLPSLTHSQTPSVAESMPPSSSKIPSAHPSLYPTHMPSLAPSSQPSWSPSSLPTTEPSARPSALPSLDPSSMPSSAPSDLPTPESLAMETTLTIPLELNNKMTGNDFVVLQDAVEKFLRMNQAAAEKSVDTDSLSVAIEIGGVYVEDVQSRPTASSDENESGRGERKRRTNVGNTAASTSEYMAKLRIACELTPYLQYVVNPDFALVPQLFGGFSLEKLFDHLEKSSGTFANPTITARSREINQTISGQLIGEINQTISEQQPIVSPLSEVYPGTNPEVSNSNSRASNIMSMGIIAAGASVLLLVLLISMFAVIRTRRRRNTTSTEVKMGDDENAGAIEDKNEARNRIFFAHNATQALELQKATRGKGGSKNRHANSAPTPTNAKWRQKVSAKSPMIGNKVTVPADSPLTAPSAFIDMHTMQTPRASARGEAYKKPVDSPVMAPSAQVALHQESPREERRIHELEHHTFSEAAVRNAIALGVDGGGLIVCKTHTGIDNDESSHVDRGQEISIYDVPKLATTDNPISSISALSPMSISSRAFPRRYTRLDSGPTTGDISSPPNPPSHPRHALAAQMKNYSKHNKHLRSDEKEI